MYALRMSEASGTNEALSSSEVERKGGRLCACACVDRNCLRFVVELSDFVVQLVAESFGVMC